MAKKCFLCKMSDVNDLELGEFLECNDVHVHYFCLLLTTGLQQNGEDDEGLLGFLIEDVRKSAQRLKKNLCYICHKPYANIICLKSNCNRKFHTLCGLNRCLYTFSGKYTSHCEKHIQIPTKEEHTKTESCLICYEPMKEFNPITSIKPICCKSGWMHKKCVAHYAKNAGYFCKCPLCNNDKEFREFIVTRGIFIPDQDAAWELEPNAYSELLERPEICQAMFCLASRRDLRNKRNRMKTCNACGAFIAHIKCWNDGSKHTVSNYICHNCTIMDSPDELSEAEENGSVCDEGIVVINDNDNRNESGRSLGRTRHQTHLMHPDSDNSCVLEEKKLRGRKIKIFARKSEIRQSLGSSNYSMTSEHSIIKSISKNDDTIGYKTISRSHSISDESDFGDSCVAEVRELRGRKIKINTSKDFDEHSDIGRSLDGNVSSSTSEYGSFQNTSRKSHNRLDPKGDGKNSFNSKKRRRISMPDNEDSMTSNFTDDTEWDASRLKRCRPSTSQGILTDISNDKANPTNSIAAIFTGTSHQAARRDDGKYLNKMNKRKITKPDGLNQTKIEMYFKKLTY